MTKSTNLLQPKPLTLKNLLRITKAVADEQRVRLIMLLEEGELCVCQLIELLGLAPSTVSKHLSILHAAGLIDCRKDGRWIYYRLAEGKEAESGRPVVTWLQQCVEDEVIRKDRAKRAEMLDADPEKLCRQRRKKAC